MIQLNPDNMVRIELTPKEQKMLLAHCQTIDSFTYNRIANAQDGVLHLLIDECYDLQNSIFTAIEQTNKPKVKDILGHVFNKLTPNPQSRAILEELSQYDFDSILSNIGDLAAGYELMKCIKQKEMGSELNTNRSHLFESC